MQPGIPHPAFVLDTIGSNQLYFFQTIDMKGRFGRYELSLSNDLRNHAEHVHDHGHRHGHTGGGHSTADHDIA